MRGEGLSQNGSPVC